MGNTPSSNITPSTASYRVCDARIYDEQFASIKNYTASLNLFHEQCFNHNSSSNLCHHCNFIDSTPPEIFSDVLHQTFIDNLDKAHKEIIDKVGHVWIKNCPKQAGRVSIRSRCVGYGRQAKLGREVCKRLQRSTPLTPWLLPHQSNSWAPARTHDARLPQTIREHG